VRSHTDCVIWPDPDCPTRPTTRGSSGSAARRLPCRQIASALGRRHDRRPSWTAPPPRKSSSGCEPGKIVTNYPMLALPDASRCPRPARRRLRLHSCSGRVRASLRGRPARLLSVPKSNLTWYVCAPCASDCRHHAFLAWGCARPVMNSYSAKSLARSASSSARNRSTSS